MRNIFPGFYKPSDEDFKRLWETALFVFDTNVLLDLYRYSEETVQNLLSTMEKLKNRIWIPYQVAFEYHRRFNDIIQSQTNAYTDAIKILTDFNNKFKEKRSHPFLNSELQVEIDEFCKKIDLELVDKQKLVKKLILENPIKESLANIIEDRIGEGFTSEEIEKICQEGIDRFANKTPPGYKDAKSKQGTDVFGDLIIWKEILKQIKNSNNPIIFVTGDVKEDWFQIVMGLTIGPRPELIDEVKKHNDVLFYIYPTDIFFRHAQELLKIEVKETTLVEVGDIIKEFRKKLDQTTSGEIESESNIELNVSDETADSNEDSNSDEIKKSETEKE